MKKLRRGEAPAHADEEAGSKGVASVHSRDQNPGAWTVSQRSLPWQRAAPMGVLE